MSLANIEGKLSPEEMENVMAGSGFWGKFWGWSDWSNGPCVDGTYNRARIYSAFWFSVSYQQENGLSC